MDRQKPLLTEGGVQGEILSIDDFAELIEKHTEYSFAYIESGHSLQIARELLNIKSQIVEKFPFSRTAGAIKRDIPTLKTLIKNSI